MAIPVKLPVFEGPLDLLMHLIEKNKIDIYDIPIVEITDQYLEYVRQMDRQDLDVTSEFLVMAATLLDIKCRMLLPREKDEETGEEEGDPREELVRRSLFIFSSSGSFAERKAAGILSAAALGKSSAKRSALTTRLSTSAPICRLIPTRISELFSNLRRVRKRSS